MASFGKRLRQLRKAANKKRGSSKLPSLTQVQFADALCRFSDGWLQYSDVDVSRWENGRRIIRAEQRDLLMTIVAILHEYSVFDSLSDANHLLASGSYLELTHVEVAKIEPKWLEDVARSSRSQPTNSNATSLPALIPTVGLEQALSDVMAFLALYQTSSTIITFTGLGGAGKSVLVTQVAHLLQEKGDTVLYIRVDSDAELSAKEKLHVFIQYLWECLSGRASGTYSISALKNRIRQQLTGQQVTIVADGLITSPEATLFCRFLETLADLATIFVTSRYRPSKDVRVDEFPLYDLPTAEAMQLLAQHLLLHRPRLDDAQMQAIVATVGGNPQVLSTTAGAIKRGYPTEALIRSIQAGKLIALAQVYSRIFAQVWRSLKAEERRVILSFLFVTERQASVDRLLMISGGGDFIQITQTAISLVDCAFLMPLGDGFEIPLMVRQFVALQAKVPHYRPIMLELSQHALNSWLLRFELLTDDQWPDLDQERHSLFQTMRTVLALVPFGSAELHNNLAQLTCNMYGFVFRRGFAQEWFPLLCNISEALPFRRDSQRCRLITNVGLIGRLVQAYEIAIEAHQEGLSIGKALNNEFEIAQSLYNLSVLYELQGELDKSLQYTSNALVLCEDLNHSEGLAACSNQLGNVNYRQGNFEVAARYFKQAKYYCDQEGMISEAARALNNLALVYRNTQHLELALEMLDQADVILKHQPNEQILAQVVLSRTIVFLAMGDTQMAKDILERFSEARLEQLGDRILYALHLNHQGEVALNQGKTEYAVSKLEQSQEVWYDIGGAIEQSVTLINLIRAYMKQDQLEKARKCYAEAVLFFNDRKQYALVRSIYPDLMELRLQIYKISEGILQHPYEC